MKKRLNWFDKLMIAITFAEAGVTPPDIKTSDKETIGLCNNCGKETTFTPTKNSHSPAHSYTPNNFSHV